MKKRLLFIVNVDWFFVSHRLPIALSAIERGYQVHLACAFTDKFDCLSSLGIRLHPLNLSRGGTTLVGEVKTILAISKIIRHLKPEIVHFVTIKPVLYGGMASRLSGVKGRVASISGLGYVFTAKDLKTRILRFVTSLLYRMALRGNGTRVIFQNPFDRSVLISRGIISAEQAVTVRGSGVCLRACRYLKEPEGTPVVSFASRLLLHKGVEEFVQAARLLKARGVEARFWLIGKIDPDNPATLTQDKLDFWREEGVVEILGYRADIPALFERSNLIVHPSYYGEGLPKVLMESAACGRAVVTTDHPGCRDAIEPGITGLLVPVGDAAALADAIQRLLEDRELRKSMGRAGRRLAEREFGIDRIVDVHMGIYDELMGSQLCN